MPPKLPLNLPPKLPPNPPPNPPSQRSTTSPTRRQLLQATLVGAVMPGLAACSPWTGPRLITLGEAELADRVARLFPQTRRLLELLDIELSAPSLRLLPESNRLALALWLRTRERLLGKAGHGQLAFDCALRWAPQDASLRLTQVRVQQLWWEVGPGPVTPPMPPPPMPPPPIPTRVPVSPTAAAGPRDATGAPPRLGPVLAEKVLEDLVIYRLGAEPQARLREAGLAPGAVTVTARGVEITLQRVAG